MTGSLLLTGFAPCYSQPQKTVENYNEVTWRFTILYRISFAGYVFVCLCVWKTRWEKKRELTAHPLRKPLTGNIAKKQQKKLRPHTSCLMSHDPKLPAWLSTIAVKLWLILINQLMMRLKELTKLNFGPVWRWCHSGGQVQVGFFPERTGRYSVSIHCCVC